MGKIVLVLLLLDISVVGTVFIGKSTGYLILTGQWRYAFLLGVLMGFLLLSTTFVLALHKPYTNRQPPQYEPGDAVKIKPVARRAKSGKRKRTSKREAVPTTARRPRL